MNGFYALSYRVADQGGFWRAVRGEAYDFAVRWVGLILIIGRQRLVNKAASLEAAAQVMLGSTNVQFDKAAATPHFQAR